MSKRKRPSKHQVLVALYKEIASWEGYRNLIGPDKGKITHPEAIRAISRLKEAIRLIKKL